MRIKTADLNEAQSKVSELERQKASFEKLKELSQGQKKELTELKEALREAKLVAQKTELSDKSRAEHLDHRLQQAEADCRGLGVDNERLTSDNSRLKAENARLSADIQRLAEDAERLRDEYLQATHQAGASQEQMSRAAAVARKADQEKQHFENECARLAKERDVLQGLLQAQRKEHDENELQLRADKRELEMRVQDQKAKITTLTKAEDRNRQLEAQQGALDEDMQRLDADRRAALAEAQQARAEVRRSENVRIQDENELARSRQNNQEMEQRLAALQSELKRSKDQAQQCRPQQLQDRQSKSGHNLNSIFAGMVAQNSIIDSGSPAGDPERLARENKELQLALKVCRSQYVDIEILLKQEQNSPSFLTPAEYIKLTKAHQGESLAYLSMRLETENCDLQTELHHCKRELAEKSQVLRQFQRQCGT